MFGLSGCTTWTSLHGGYGFAERRQASLAGLEVRRAIGGALHSPYVLIGARVDGGPGQIDAEAELGVMGPLRLSEHVSLVPSAKFDLLRATSLDGKLYGGAFGPGIATELLWWAHVKRVTREQSPSWGFGCMGGAIGVDCPRACRVHDVTRHGLGLKVAAEYDLLLGADYPRLNSWTLWATLGFTRAVSKREDECCYFDHGQRPTRQDCGLLP